MSAGEHLQRAGVYNHFGKFLFVHDMIASVAPPLLELKGVKKLVVKGRENGRVTFRLPTDDLFFLGPNLVPVLEPGRFQIHVGQSADPADLLTEFFELTP